MITASGNGYKIARESSLYYQKNDSTTIIDEIHHTDNFRF